MNIFSNTYSSTCSSIKLSNFEGDEHSLPPWTPWMMTLNALRVALLSPQLLSYFVGLTPGESAWF